LHSTPQAAAVVENERGHAKSRIELAEELRPVRAIDDRDVHRLVLEA